MFKESIAKITASIAQGLDNTLGTGRTSQAKSITSGVFAKIIEQGISDLTHRSPILGNVAESIYESKKVSSQRKQDITNFMKSDIGSAHKEKFEDPDKKQMLSVLTKLSKSIEDVGEHNTMQSALYKQYSKMFDDYRNSLIQRDTPETNTGDELVQISKNTKRTADSISGLTGNNQQSVAPREKVTTVKKALDNVGGKLINKVLDDSAIHNISEMVKKMFADKDGETVAKPKPADKAQPTQNTPTPDQPKPVTPAKPTIDPVAPEPPKPQKKHKLSAGGNVVTDDYNMFDKTPVRYGSIHDLPIASAQPVAKKPVPVKQPTTTDAIKQVREKVLPRRDSKGKFIKSTPNIMSTVPKVADTIASTASTVAETGGVLRTIGTGIAGAVETVANLPIAAVGLAGAVGAGVGTVASRGIDAAISSATGRDNSLGSWLYDKFNPDPVTSTPVPTRTPVARPTQEQVKKISQMVDRKSDQDNKSKSQSQQPIVISQNSSSGKSGGSTTNVIVPTSVRNNESTFERVQMQDYWSRVS